MADRTDRIELSGAESAAMELDVWLPPVGHGPGLLLIQEVFGVGPYISAVAERLAALGYVVAAPDVFWRFHPRWVGAHTPDGVGESIAKAANLDVEAATGDCAAALAHLGGLAEVDGAPGVIGFCLGGTLAFRVAVRAEPSVCIAYYGSGIPTMLDDVAKVTCPLLLHFGSLDPYIPGAAVESFTAAAAGQRNVVINIEIAGHAFDNHEASMFYAESAANAAWAKTVAFLGEHLPVPAT